MNRKSLFALFLLCIATTKVKAISTSVTVLIELCLEVCITIEGDVESQLGTSVAVAGNINGDANADIFVGAYGYLDGANDGAGFLLYGGLSSNVDLSGSLSSSTGVSIKAPTGGGYELGMQVAGGADVNGDGVADVLAGAPGANNGDGMVYVIFGAKFTSDITATTGVNGISGKGITITIANGKYGVGTSVSLAGDVNGDGNVDILIGVPGYGSHGAAWIVYGGANLKSNIDLSTMSSSQGIKITGSSVTQIGMSVAGVGDANGDGLADVLVGAPNYGGAGSAYLIFGSRSRLSLLGSINLDSLVSLLLGTTGIKLTGSTSDSTGASVAGLGDINGDGYADFMLGSPGAGAGYLVYGSGSLLTSISLSSLLNVAGAGGVKMTMSGGADASLGAAVSGAGDINGDGWNDIMIGAPNYGDDDNGAVFIIYGSASISSNIDVTAMTTVQGYMMIGASGYLAGSALASGDINGDGNSDILIGAPGANVDAGATFIIYGGITCPAKSPSASPSKVPTGVLSASPSKAPVSVSTGKPSTAPVSVSTGKPSTAPVAVSTGKPSTAPVSVSTSKPSLSPATVKTTKPSKSPVGVTTSKPSKSPVGVTTSKPSKAPVAVTTAKPSKAPVSATTSKPSKAPVAATTTKPSKSPVAASTSKPSKGAPTTAAPTYSTPTTCIPDLCLDVAIFIEGSVDAFLGTSVAAAGKINADTKDDIFIGAYGYLNGGLDGAAYLLYGGLTSNVDLSGSLSASTGLTVKGPTGGDYELGMQVAGGADVNGDGVADVLAGAPGANSGDGMVYVIFGAKFTADISVGTGTNGISGKGITITIAGGKYGVGTSVSIAGDVNGDGNADILIGVPNFGANGAAWIVYGGASLKSNIDLSTMSSSQGFKISGSLVSQIGASVSGVGDVNGDGMADILIGAPNVNAAGSAYLVFGSKLTFSLLSSLNLDSLTTLTSTLGIKLTGSTSDSAGASVAGMGDVNADGYADFMIGAPGSGEAYLVFGGAAMINTDLTALISFLGTGGSTLKLTGGAEASLGAVVHGVGDINADGYADISISAPGLSCGSCGGDNNGAVFVIYGSASLSSTIDLTSLTANAGFMLCGGLDFTAGTSIDHGDFNGDGNVDLLIGAAGANADAGVSIIIYGGIDCPAIPSAKPTKAPSNSEKKSKLKYDIGALQSIGGW